MAKLGTEFGGFVAEKSCDSIEDAVEFLKDEAVKRYPESEFARMDK